jgi:hypothetical protein
MSERIQQGVPDLRLPHFIEQLKPLPSWLADRLLRPDEKVAWVRGPRFNPSWERYATNPVLIFVAPLVGVIFLSLVWSYFKRQSELAPLTVLVPGGFFVFFLPTLFIVGIASGYFTRLVVTNFRIVILQGYEICRTWNIDDLPPSLLHYRRLDGQNQRPIIDLDAVKNMLGGSSEKFTAAKSILAFGKQLDSITTRDKNRP